MDRQSYSQHMRPVLAIWDANCTTWNAANRFWRCFLFKLSILWFLHYIIIVSIKYSGVPRIFWYGVRIQAFKRLLTKSMMACHW